MTLKGLDGMLHGIGSCVAGRPTWQEERACIEEDVELRESDLTCRQRSDWEGSAEEFNIEF